MTSTLNQGTRSFAHAIWSLRNAFTSAFKELEAVPQIKAMAKLGEPPESRFLPSLEAKGGVGLAAIPRYSLLVGKAAFGVINIRADG